MVDYQEVAEYIVQNVPSVVPEYVGERLAEAEATIDSGLRGMERTAALNNRAYARNWLTSTAEHHGYKLPEGFEPEAVAFEEEPLLGVGKTGEYTYTVDNVEVTIKYIRPGVHEVSFLVPEGGLSEGTLAKIDSVIKRETEVG